MTNKFMVMLFQHNHWANQQIIQACKVLTIVSSMRSRSQPPRGPSARP